MSQLSTRSTHSLGFSVGDHEKNDWFLRTHVWAIHTIIPSTLQLNHIVSFQCLEPRITNDISCSHSVRVDEILKVVLFFELLLRHEIVELRQDTGSVVRYVGDPAQLSSCFDISVGREQTFESSLHLRYLDNAPPNQNDLIVNLDILDIRRFEEYFLRQTHNSLSKRGILRVESSHDEGVVAAVRAVGDKELNVLAFINGHETLSCLVNLLLVFGPKLVPLHIDDATRGAL
mmetsp:Transcript_5893/g.10325  ORF Transcript_5893/g.10325 Transcript_5893/m.10325 type:complete len:231 (-) Transcript_5893:1248-1940(-)